MSSVYMHGTGTSISITSLTEQLEMQDVGFEAETASPRGPANWRCGQVPLTLKYPRCGKKMEFTSVLWWRETDLQKVW